LIVCSTGCRYGGLVVDVFVGSVVCVFKVECGSEYAWRYGGESAMVIVLVYLQSFSFPLISV